MSKKKIDMKKYLVLSALIFVASVSSAQSLKEAQKLNDNEQYESANVMYKQLVMKEPNNGTIWFYYGENMLDADNQDSAMLMFNKGLQVDPSNPLNNIGLAEIKLSQSNMQEAKPFIDKALATGANKNVVVLMEAADAYTHFKTKDLMSAQTLLASALKLEPKNADLYVLNGDVYSELNNGTEAANNYNQALTLDKTQVKAVLHKGQLYKRSTNYEGAAEEFRKAITIDPNFAPAYRELGEVSWQLRKFDDANANYKKYLELSKNNDGARLRYISFLYSIKKFPEALAEFSQITKVDSSNLGYIRLGSYLYYETNDTVKALAFISRLFNMTDSTKRGSRDYEYYGKMLAKSGQDSVGLGYIRKAYNMEPTRTELLSEMFTIYQKAKKYDSAASVLEEKIATGKNVMSNDYLNLGKTYYTLRMPEKADSAFAKYAGVQPNWAPIYAWRGRTNAMIDSTAKQGLAKPFYEKYIEVATQDTANIGKYKKDLMEANQYLAFYYFVKKDCEQSIAYWKKVLEFDPDNKQAKDSIKQIREDKSCR